MRKIDSYDRREEKQLKVAQADVKARFIDAFPAMTSTSSMGNWSGMLLEVLKDCKTDLQMQAIATFALKIVKLNNIVQVAEITGMVNKKIEEILSK